MATVGGGGAYGGTVSSLSLRLLPPRPLPAAPYANAQWRALALNEGSMVGPNVYGAPERRREQSHLVVQRRAGLRRYNGMLTIGAPQLNLISTALGGLQTPVALIRRPVVGELAANPTQFAQRYFTNVAPMTVSLRIMLDDYPAGATITSPPTAGACNNSAMTLLDTVSATQPIDLATLAFDTGTGFNYAAGHSASATWYNGLPLPLSKSQAGGPGAYIPYPGSAPNDGYWQALNRPIITGCIKIELVNAAGVATDVTKEILNLGITGRNINPQTNVGVQNTLMMLPMFHKPRGLVTTARDPEGRQTVFAVLPPDLPRLVAIGRLDINTEGLLLLTNDGGLARVLELPSTGWLRRYRVRAHGNIDQAALDRLAEGVTIDGVDYLRVEAKLDREQGANAWLTLGLREGKKREIKKILEHLGLAVNRLIRVSFGPFELGDLPEAEVMEVRTRVLRDQLGVKLAKEANVDFDAPQVVAVEIAARAEARRTAARRARAARIVGVQAAMPGRPDRGARGAEKIDSNGTPHHTALPRRRPHPSAGASMSRLCARKSPLTPRRRGSASSAARPTTARGGQSQSSACPALAKRRAQAPRPKRGRNAAGVRALATAADAHLEPARVGASPIPSGPSERAAPKDASGRRVRTIKHPEIGPSGQMLRGKMAGRQSAASTAPRRKGTAIVGDSRRDRGTAPIRRANASLTAPKAGRAPKPARAGSHEIGRQK